LRRFSSAKKFFGFTLRALTKRSLQQALYLYTRDLKSVCNVPDNLWTRPASPDALYHCRPGFPAFVQRGGPRLPEPPNLWTFESLHPWISDPSVSLIHVIASISSRLRNWSILMKGEKV